MRWRPARNAKKELTWWSHEKDRPARVDVFSPINVLLTVRCVVVIRLKSWDKAVSSGVLIDD